MLAFLYFVIGASFIVSGIAGILFGADAYGLLAGVIILALGFLHLVLMIPSQTWWNEFTSPPSHRRLM